MREITSTTYLDTTDFDGDEMTGNPIFENEAARKFSVLHPANRIHNTKSFGIASGVSLTYPVLSTLSAFLSSN